MNIQNGCYSKNIEKPMTVRICEFLKLSFPYDWSNPNIADDKLIYIVLENTVYADIIKIMKFYGYSHVYEVFVNGQWDDLTKIILTRMINNANIGLFHYDNYKKNRQTMDA